MFSRLPAPPEDALHGVMARYAADNRSFKMDLGVGVYRDATGASPIMRAVQTAETAHIAEQESKSYMSLRGDPVFLKSMQSLAFGDKFDGEMASIQSVGGTGGIRLALNLAAQANPNLKVIIGTPTWPVHFTICELLGLETVAYPYFEHATQKLQFNALREALLAANEGDIFILHGPCHNPTGEDLSAEHLDEVLAIALQRGLIPLIDAAYYGLGAELTSDLKRLARIVKTMPRAIIVMSCSKAFGLYRERTGVLFIKAAPEDDVNVLQKSLERLARNTYSMPPAHGAAVVGRILSDETLKRDWQDELHTMKTRISDVRRRLVKASQSDPRIAAVAHQKGIFSLLPISPETVTHMAQAHGIYMPASGRINIAGFKRGDEARFCQALQDIAL